MPTSQKYIEAALVAVAVAFCTSITPCLAAPYDHTKLYQKGRKASLEGYPRKAIFYLAAAVEQRSSEGEPWVVAYGHHRVPYLPYYYLGRARLEIGDYEQALEAWAESEKQGAIQGAPEYQDLLERRESFYRDVLPRIVDGLRAEIEQAFAVIKDARKVLEAISATHLNTSDLEQRWIPLPEMLMGAGKASEGTGNDIHRIEKARKVTSAALAEAMKILGAARERALSVPAVRIDDALAHTLGSLRPDGCQQEALDRLEALRQFLDLRPDLRSLEREGMFGLALSRAYFRCGELEAAAAHLATVETQGGDLLLEEAELLRRGLEEATGKRSQAELEGLSMQDAALTGFVEPAALIDTGVCDRAVIERLTATAEKIRLDPDRLKLAAWVSGRAEIPYVPQLYLAKAYKSCGDVDGVERSLERGSERQEKWLNNYGREAEAIDAWVRVEKIKKLYSGSYALVLLASRYQRWESLPGVEAENRLLEEKLRRVGFDKVDIVRDPTRRRFLDAIQGFIKSFGSGVENHNRLMIYFAGHGETLTLGGDNTLGFVVPVDAARKPPSRHEYEDFMKTAISMDEVDGWARQMAASHVLFVFNSCYSGTIFKSIYRARGGGLPTLVSESMREPVRLFITAGSDKQEVPDSSVFLRSMLSALTWEENADVSQDGFLTGSELCLFLKNRVTSESGISPLCGTMPPPFNLGDLVFARPTKDAASRGLPRTRVNPRDIEEEIAFWRSSEESGSAEDLKRYLERYPRGRFTGLARVRLERIALGSR